MQRLDSNYLEALKVAAETALTTAQACLEIAKQLQSEADESKWKSPETAAQLIGDISAEMLVDRCRDGRLKYGLHFINTSDGKRSNYLINAAAVRKFFEQDPAKRPPIA